MEKPLDFKNMKAIKSRMAEYNRKKYESDSKNRLCNIIETKVKTLVDKNKKKGINTAGKYAKNIVRAGGRFVIPVAALMSIFDAATGVAQAGELLDKEEGEELTFRDKASAGFAGFLSGLTFGFVDKKATAKYLAGDREPVDSSLKTRNRKLRREESLDRIKALEKNEGATLDQLEIDNSIANRKSFRHGMVNNNNAQVNNNNIINKTDSFLPHMIAKNKDNTIQSVETGVVY